MTVETKEVVTTISYLIGVRKDILELNFAECKDTLDKLYADRESTFFIFHNSSFVIIEYSIDELIMSFNTLL